MGTTMDKLRELLPNTSPMSIMQAALNYYLMHVEHVTCEVDDTQEIKVNTEAINGPQEAQ